MSKTFTSLFLAQAAAAPAQAAIVEAGQRTYSYGELASRAGQIATELKKRELEKECVLGLCLDKSADYVATMLGAWFAGAAFVPLDPGLPAERLQYMCTQAGVKLIAHRGDASLTAKLGATPRLNLCDWPDLWQKSQKEPEFEPAELCASDLAYIIFTSGSTGLPKGVCVEHRGLVNFLEAQIKAFAVDRDSHCLWYLSQNFDASVSDLGTALLAGATIFIEPMCDLQPGAGLETTIANRAITHMDIPPAVLRVMDPEKLPPSVETIIIGGEACAPDTVRAFAGRTRLVNVYGPTESTVCTSLGRCGTDWDRPLIGQPLPGIDYYVLDGDLQSVAPGVSGKLYIGGVALARGYAGREDLTATKFITHNGVRLYDTNDIVLHCPDGEYQFIGRSDRQFKLRGMLIEPEEIEARLVQHPDVQRAAVLKRSLKLSEADNLSRQILVAFVDCMARDADTNTLRKHLEQSLPKWMVPQRFEFVDQLPLTVTGKVDLKALAVRPLQSSANGTESPLTEPQLTTGSTETLLSHIWHSVLGIKPARQDDFFELGGDSFALVEAVVAAQARGLSISPALFIAHPVFGDLLQALERGTDKNPEMMTAAQLRADIAPSEERKAALAAAAKRPPFSGQKPACILLTGATGFLGARILRALLQKTKARIYCLVRADDEKQALERINAALKVQEPAGGDNEITAGADYRKRIIPLCGALEKKRFGLSDSDWHHLADAVDTIFHSAAQVNMLLPYEHLRVANVEGTIQIASFMLSGPAKALHYASTLSVFVATDQNTGRLEESDHLEQTKNIYGGYAQTKWAAEVMLRDLAGAAGPVTYHRLGLITGDTTFGISSAHDFLELFVRGIVSLGCIPPVDPQLSIDITPIDYATAAMVELSLQAMSTGKYDTYHIANPRSLPLERLLQRLAAAGKTIEVVPAEQFKEALRDRADALSPAESAAALALCRTMGDSDFQTFRTMDLFQATNVSFGMDNTLHALSSTGIACPEPSDELIDLYLRRIFSSILDSPC
ncbi:MAG: amino acid adenylation domain-containing protein [Cyanobacteria bacterium REEB67]|nr:amino acid adenylation domain-containing protein [Cyanobacteria bacterium REEB67]